MLKVLSINMQDVVGKINILAKSTQGTTFLSQLKCHDGNINYH